MSLAGGCHPLCVGPHQAIVTPIELVMGCGLGVICGKICTHALPYVPPPAEAAAALEAKRAEDLNSAEMANTTTERAYDGKDGQVSRSRERRRYK
eukprot:8853748-Pyramimonas_sp.AAC.1